MDLVETHLLQAMCDASIARTTVRVLRVHPAKLILLHNYVHSSKFVNHARHLLERMADLLPLKIIYRVLRRAIVHTNTYIFEYFYEANSVPITIDRCVPL